MYIIYISIYQDCGAVGFVDFTKLLFALYSLAEPFSRVRSICNTKPAQSLRRTFLRRNSRKNNKSDSKMAAPEASVHPWFTRLDIVFVTISFFTKRTKAVPKVFKVG